MGLLDKFKKKPEPKQTITFEQFDEEFVNLSPNMVKAKVEDRGNGDESAYYRDCRIVMDDKKIQIRKGSEVLAEVTSRAKAYKELEPYAGKVIHDVAIRKRSGDYGDYYRTRIRVKTGERTEEI